MTALDYINNALREIGVYDPGEALSAADAQFGLDKLNALLDEWAARDVYAYNVAFTPYTLVANLSPHTIGPTGATFTVPIRPMKIESASLILTNTTPVTDLPIRIRDDAWWANQNVKGLTSNVPTDLYYSPDWPNGQLFFWPVPNFDYGVRLETWTLLQQIASLAAVISLPPAYQKAITLTLAEELAGPFGVTMPAALPGIAMKARKAVMGNNISSPRISTAEPGQTGPSGTGVRADFNWVSGQPW